VERINEAPEAPGAAKPQPNFEKQLTTKDFSLRALRFLVVDHPNRRDVTYR
jgi:hypothetical protein